MKNADNASSSQKVPEGFNVLEGNEDGFNAFFGPYHVRVSDGVPVLGFRVQKWHLNSAGNCHGGAIAAFGDYIGPMLRSLAGTSDRPMSTITISIDYLAPVPSDAWVELHARLLRRTQRMLFGDAVMIVDGAVVARIDGIYRVGGTQFQGSPPDPTTMSAE